MKNKFWRIHRPYHDKQLYSLLFLEPLYEISWKEEDVDIKVSCRLSTIVFKINVEQVQS